MEFIMSSASRQTRTKKINPKLEKLIEKMPDDRKLVLLKQLLKNEVTSALIELIGALPEENQSKLLVQLEESQTIPVSAVETEISIRDHSRKSCMISAQYAVNAQEFESLILDISPAGAFIETSEVFTSGQRIELTFSLPNTIEPLTVYGAILWKGMLGIGIRFKDLTLADIAAINAYMQAEEEKT